MYNYDKIIGKLKTIENYVTEPKEGDILIGQFVGYVTPSGFNKKFIAIQQEVVTSLVKFHKQLEHEFNHKNIKIGDHIAMMAKGKHDFDKWNQKLVRWVVLKLKKVGDVYE